MTLRYKIITYLGRTPDFREEVKLQDDGDGVVYIKEWNATDKTAYGDIGDQLDLLYKDIVAGKLDTTGEWAKKIKAVKDANAKE